MQVRPLGAQLQTAGGAYVRRNFTTAARDWKIGEVVSAEILQSFSNTRALVNTGKLELFPSAPGGVLASQPAGERFVVKREDGKFDVVQGFVVNDKPLTAKMAAAMAAAPKPNKH
jgi:hypothetical protein